MRNKDLALRVLSTAATLSIVTSMAASAFAGNYDLKNGSVNVRVDKDSAHYVRQGENEEKKDEDGKVTITSDGKETSNTITVDVEKGGKADITLKDANIKSSTDAAMKVTGKGDVDIELDGDNKLTSGATGDNNHAGLEKNDRDSTGHLTIKDEKNDDGSDKTGESTDTTGSLTATGSDYGAGIGGSGYSDSKGGESTSSITIKGGTITAKSGINGVGIGGGASFNGNGGSGGKANPDDPDDRSGTITIEGGTVTAEGGIGGGNGNSHGGDGYVTIRSGKVTATNDHGTGIGGGTGNWGGKGTVTITGGHITAIAAGAGIGGGQGTYKGGDGKVIITNGATIEKAIGRGGAGIGGGQTSYGSYEGGTGEVEISEGALVKEAVGGNGSAGIGGGSGSSYYQNQNGVGGVGRVTIKDATVEIAKGGMSSLGDYAIAGAGIGNGGGKGKFTRKNSYVKIINSVIGKLVKNENGEPTRNSDGSYVKENDSGAIGGSNQANDIGNGSHAKGSESSTVKIDDASIVGKGGGAVAHKHTVAADGWTINEDATCTEDGVKTGTCTDCGESVTSVIPAKGHTSGDWEVKTAPTYTKEGEEVIRCTECSAVLDSRVIPKLVDNSSNNAVTIDTAIRVVGGSGSDILHDGAQVSLYQVGSVLYIRAETEETAVLEGILSDLSQLMDNGIDTIVFITSQRTSTIHLAEVVALGSGETPFALSHNGAEATLTVGGADHSELIH